MRVRELNRLCLAGVLWVCALPVGIAEVAPGGVDPAAPVDLAELTAFSQREGLSGDDLSTALWSPTQVKLPGWLTSRPSSPDDLQLSLAKPSIRIHIAAGLASTMADRDHDGVPDRAAAAMRTAQRTLDYCSRHNLGQPADDGDGEVDIFLVNLGGTVRGYAALERLHPPGRGASGFVVLDGSAAQDDQDFAGMVSRSVARLVFASHDASAPVFWSEPSACWVQARVSGPPFELHRAIQARWNHPELGLTSRDPILARGNVSMLWTLDNPKLENRALTASWRALAARESAASAYETLDQTLASVTGLGLVQLRTRAAIGLLASGVEPSRYSLSIAQLPGISLQPNLPLARGGLALVSLTPDPRQPEGTRLTLLTDDPDWEATLLAQRKEGSWDEVTIQPSPDGTQYHVDLPWQDYRRAVILLERGEGPAQGTFLAHAESIGPTALFALSSLAARRRPDGIVEISWGSTWERGLFGWLVEQAPGPEGPWRLVQEVALPALGLPQEGTSYSVLEPRSREGFPSYYRVVAVTSDGLRASGPVVAAGL